MRGINATFQAIGILLAGFLVTKLFYEKTLFLLMALSFLVFPNVKMLIDKKRYKISVLSVVRALDFRDKSKKFKNFVAILFLLGLSWGFTDSYIFPLFLKEMGIRVESIGLLLGVRVLLIGVFAYLFHSIWSNKNKILIGGLLVSLLLLTLPFTNKTVLPFLIILLGAVTGIGAAGREAIFTEVTDHNSLGADIGILMIGSHIGMSVAQAVSGFVITSFGFSLVFFVAAILYALFSVAAFYNMD
jgi:MFS family permease